MRRGQTDVMSIELRPATADDVDAMFAVDQISFGHTMTDAERERARSLIDLERFRVADDAGRIVGVAGSFALELTVPGGAAVPMTGTTWVSVLPTHRRRGLLRGLLDAVHADGVRRGDVVAGLLASEGAIYGRFGYGVATRWRIVELDRRRARLGVDGESLASSTVTLIDPATGLDELFARYERWRRTRVGEVNRTREWIAARIADQQGVRGALCDDGYALWTVTPEWGEGQPDHELRLLDLVASTPEAHASLWKLLLSIDLVGPIRSRTAVSLDDPLGQLLDDPRQLRTVALNDMLWLKPTNVGALFGARRYRVAGVPSTPLS